MEDIIQSQIASRYSGVRLCAECRVPIPGDMPNSLAFLTANQMHCSWYLGHININLPGLGL